MHIAYKTAGKQEFKDLLRLMDDHLAEEERSYPKILLDSGFTEEDEKQAVGEILQGLELDGLGLGGGGGALGEVDCSI